MGQMVYKQDEQYKLAEWLIPWKLYKQTEQLLMLTSSLVSHNYFCTCGSLPSAVRVDSRV